MTGSSYKEDESSKSTKKEIIWLIFWTDLNIIKEIKKYRVLMLKVVKWWENVKKFLSFLCQKVNRPGFALGETLLGTHKVQKLNLHLT